MDFIDLYKARVLNPENRSEVIDQTSTLNIIPNTWGFMNQLGIFENHYGTQRTFGFNIREEKDILIEARNWGERNNWQGGQEGAWIQFNIPHYPLDDSIVPTDLQGKVDLSGSINPETAMLRTLAGVRMDKMERIRRAHALNLNQTRMQVIKDGTVTAGNLTYNYYDAFGVTRKVVNLGLSSLTDNPKSALGEVFGEMQDAALMGDTITNMVAFCSTSFFDALSTNQFVTEAFGAIAQPQSLGILTQRLESGLGLDSRYRTLLYENIYFVEVRGTFAGQPIIEDGKAYLLPLGTKGVFETHFAPADKFSYVNAMAQEVYLFESLNDDDDFVKLASQSNFLNLIRRPQLVITLDKD